MGECLWPMSTTKSKSNLLCLEWLQCSEAHWATTIPDCTVCGWSVSLAPYLGLWVQISNMAPSNWSLTWMTLTISAMTSHKIRFCSSNQLMSLTLLTATSQKCHLRVVALDPGHALESAQGSTTFPQIEKHCLRYQSRSGPMCSFAYTWF